MKLIGIIVVFFCITPVYAGGWDATKAYSEKILEATKAYSEKALDATKEFGEKALDATKTYSEEALDATKEYREKALDATKTYGEKALDATKTYGEKALDATKVYGEKAMDTTSELFTTDEGGGNSKSKPDKKDDSFSEIWTDVFPKLEEARNVFDKIPNAPDFSWIGSDKKSLRKDLNAILDEVLVLMDDKSISKYRERFQSLRGSIKQKNLDIQESRESRVAAPISHPLKKTKSGYDESIKNLRLEIEEIEKEIDRIKIEFTGKLQEVGIDLTVEQTGILLSRVDSENIIQMSVVFKVLKSITEQLILLTKSTHENMTVAKKYYGMHVILLETVVFMQNKYISQVDNIYIPKLKNIVLTMQALKRIAIKASHTDSDGNRQNIYRQNAKAQDLTINIASMYTDILKKQRGKIVTARKNVKKDLLLAINTYATVKLSSELLQMLKNSKNSFDTLINLQVPEIVPFENLEMQKKFEELTVEISK